MSVIISDAGENDLEAESQFHESAHRIVSTLPVEDVQLPKSVFSDVLPRKEAKM